MKKTIFKEFSSIYGVGVKTATKLHKKIGLNLRKFPLKLKKNQQDFLTIQSELNLTNKELKLEKNKTIKFLLKIKKLKNVKFNQNSININDNKKTNTKKDREK